MFFALCVNFFVFDHPNLSLAQAYLATVYLHIFWSISGQYPDLVCRLHVQIRLMGKTGTIIAVVEISAGHRTRPTGNPFCPTLQSRKCPIIFTSFG